MNRRDALELWLALHPPQQPILFSTKGGGSGPTPAQFERNGSNVNGAVVAGPPKRRRRKARRSPDPGWDMNSGRRHV